MSKINIFLILSGYQLTWISCIFGEIYFNSYLGLIIGFLYLFFFFYFIKDRHRAFKIILLFSLIGYVFDSLIVYFNIYSIKSDIIFLFLPIWFIVLWPSFITLFVSVLTFLRDKKILSIFLGITFAPFTYYLGIPLGIAHSNNIFIMLIFMVIFWGGFLYLYSYYLDNYDASL